MKTYIDIIFENKVKLKNLIENDSISYKTKVELLSLSGSYEVIGADAIKYWLNLLGKSQTLIDDTLAEFDRI
jgi:hypothetical protein